MDTKRTYLMSTQLRVGMEGENAFAREFRSWLRNNEVDKKAPDFRHAITGALLEVKTDTHEKVNLVVEAAAATIDGTRRAHEEGVSVIAFYYLKEREKGAKGEPWLFLDMDGFYDFARDMRTWAKDDARWDEVKPISTRTYDERQKGGPGYSVVQSYVVPIRMLSHCVVTREWVAAGCPRPAPAPGVQAKAYPDGE